MLLLFVYLKLSINIFFFVWLYINILLHASTQDLCNNFIQNFNTTGHSSWVYSVTYSPDGLTLASGSGNKTINIWRIR
ncbi:WD40 repeat domain-containing protein [Anabaena sp. 4-3]|uniref:WD40 repeat domain-containing protein n=1 Tax=Anabaena sp. 4-3 TaxID=1811979 RepID=UPI001E449587|nr:hypothetical protein [Anabaena sp. 4-3]